MSLLVRSIAPFVFALCILDAKEAAADLPPPFCTTEGAACRLADLFPGGVCKAGTCTRPGGGAGAAGSDVISYDCLVCVNPHGGAGGSGAAGGGSAVAGEGGVAGAIGDGGASGEGGAIGVAGTSGDAGANGAAGAIGDGGANGAGGSTGAGGSGGSIAAVDDGGCSCSLLALGSERGIVALMLGLGLVALRISRRRQ